MERNTRLPPTPSRTGAVVLSLLLGRNLGVPPGFRRDDELKLGRDELNIGMLGRLGTDCRVRSSSEERMESMMNYEDWKGKVTVYNE